MKNFTALSVTLALCAAMTTASIVTPLHPKANAASAKEWIQISEQATYYGEARDDKPNGRGTIQWGTSKQYSGDFVDGIREGSGKYINEYTEDGLKHKVVYQGTWKQDQMNGNGTYTHKVTDGEGSVTMNEIQTGTFQKGLLQTGYDVIHALADPDFSFTYTSPQETFNIMGGNLNMKASFTKGMVFSADYRKGSIRKSYSIFPAETAAKQRKNDADLKYMKSIQNHLNPYIVVFERLSKQVPLQ